MNSAIQNQPVSKIDVTVMSIDGDVIILEYANQQILWPRHQLSSCPTVGDHLVLELKAGQISSIQKIVDTAKKDSGSSRGDSAASHREKSPQELEKMRKLLEALIN